MHNLGILSFLLLLLFSACQQDVSHLKDEAVHRTYKDTLAETDFALVVHGGAGTITRSRMTPDREKAYRDMLNEVLETGRQILDEGGRAEDAVTAVISMMEDSPLFNAGKGAVFTHEGTNELDASIMYGKDLSAGAVGGVQRIRNPILAAQAVLLHSEHVLLTGRGAETFAEKQGIQQVEPSYFYTDSRWESLERAKSLEKAQGDLETQASDYKYGTVGAVALDRNGNIVAGTSTGGMTNKRYGRIGDSPLIGAGSYADNQSCGVSCTGHGEYFIRYAVAHRLSAMMTYGNMPLIEAADSIIHGTLKQAGGEGGLIALDRKGRIAMPFNTEGMYRGFVTDQSKYIGIYKDD